MANSLNMLLIMLMFSIASMSQTSQLSDTIKGQGVIQKTQFNFGKTQAGQKDNQVPLVPQPKPIIGPPIPPPPKSPIKFNLKLHELKDFKSLPNNTIQ